MRTGASLIETLVVLAIIGLLLGLLFPVLQSARQRAVDMECKNNLHQINIAIAQFAETQKRLPGPGANGLVGGWTIDVLPFLEQKNLHARITPGTTIAAAPDFLLRQPTVFRCTTRTVSESSNPSAMDQSHYVFCPDDKRKTYSVADAPIDLRMPWAGGPEMSFSSVIRRTGPHQRGFFYASGFQQGVDFVSGEQTTP